MVQYFRVFLLLFHLFEVDLSLQHDQSPKIHKRLEGTNEKNPKVQHNVATKHTLDYAKYPNARCLDGTQGAYYFSPAIDFAGSKKFYIYRMGGAFCTDLNDCYGRSQTQLGSSLDDFWADTMDLNNAETADRHMGFSRVQTENPLMWNWNHISVIYCDGAYFAGSNATSTIVDGKQIFFHGGDIQSAILYDLKEKYGLDTSEEMVVGGCSAGGISTFMTVDWIAAHPAAPKSAQVAAFTCSGYFLAVDEPPVYYTTHKKFPFEVQNTSGMMSKKCLNDQQSVPHSCVLSEINAPYVKTPIFIWESRYDSYRLKHAYECSDPACANNKSSFELKALMKLHMNTFHTGLFLTGCSHHCEDSPKGTVANLKPIDGDLPLTAFAKWYKNYFSGSFLQKKFNNRIWVEWANFPCADCCPASMHQHRSWLHDLE